MSEVSPLTWLGGACVALEAEANWNLVAALADSKGTSAALFEPLGFRHDGHWVVVDGISQEGVVWVRDPAGKAYGVPIAEFLDLWHYTMVVIEEVST